MKKELICRMLPVALCTACLLAGCSGQSVTYDPSGVRPTEAPVFSEPVAETKAPESAAAVSSAETPAETPEPTASPTETPSPTPTAIAPTVVTTTPDPDAGLTLIGEKTDSETLIRAKLTNATGLGISYLSVKDSFTDNFPPDLLEEKDVMKDREARVLYYDYAHAAKESAEREERARYDIRLELKTASQVENPDSEGRYLELHDVPFADFDEAEIHYDEGDGIVYLTYTSRTTGVAASTEEAELTRRNRNASSYEEASSDGEASGGAEAGQTGSAGNSTDGDSSCDTSEGDSREETETNSENADGQEEAVYETYEDNAGDDDDGAYTPIEDEGDDEDYVEYFDDEGDEGDGEDVFYYEDDYEEYEEVAG